MPSYDFSGLPALHATFATMLAAQTAGTAKFAGGNQRWLVPATGAFTATWGTYQAATVETTRTIGERIKAMRGTFDLLGVTKPPATTYAPLSALLAGIASFGRAKGVPASGPWDFFGLIALANTVNAMLADQVSGASNFAGGNQPYVKAPTGWFVATWGTYRAASVETVDTIGAQIRAAQAVFDRLGR